MQKLVVIQQALHDRVLAARNLQRLVASAVFERLFNGASEVDQESLHGHIQRGNRDAVEAWIKDQQSKQEDASTLSMRDLRIKASQLGIVGYGWMPKASLLSAIHNKTKETNGTAATGDSQTSCGDGRDNS